MSHQKLINVAAVLFILALSVAILIYAKSFLVPITIAALLSMLLLPVSKWLERKGLNKGLSIILSMFLLIIFFAAVAALIAWQISDIFENAHALEQQITKKTTEMQELITEKLGVSKKKQEDIINKEQDTSSSKLGTFVLGFFKGAGGILANSILVLVYIFLFTYFRAHFKRFIIQMVPQQQQANAHIVIQDARKVAQQYLTGLSLMIVILWIM
ncbi:MAG TPA: AI-2E family transporter, partial [Cytophagales bacterium]|nr:AI-2E family transporter [Cytophagales bacterium]